MLINVQCNFFTWPSKTESEMNCKIYIYEKLLYISKSTLNKLEVQPRCKAICQLPGRVIHLTVAS